MIPMSIFIFLFSFVIYMILTAGSGSIGFWSLDEIMTGFFVSLVTSLLVWRLLKGVKVRPKFFIPKPCKILIFILYLFIFFYHVIKANLNVAYRIITGKIRPGIVKISPGLKTNLAITMLANSITLTPGTLTVDIDGKKNLYVHCINLKNKKPCIEDICSSLHKWIRRIIE